MIAEAPFFGYTQEVAAVFPVSGEASIRSHRELYFRHPDGVNIHVSPTPEEARLSMADDILNVLANAEDGQTVILSTGNSSSKFYPVFIEQARERGIDLTRFHYGHLDNYAYDPQAYPDGTDNEDYEKYLRRHFIEPAGIPEDHFHPIRGLSDHPEEVAAEYDAWLSTRPIVAAIAGAMGPEPVVHFAFMKPGMDLERGVSVIDLSEETVERDRQRAIEGGYPPPPDRAFTLGLPHLRRARHLFNINCGPEYRKRVELALTGPVDPNVIATYLRTEGFRDKVHIYLDNDTSAAVSAILFGNDNTPLFR